MSLGLEFDPSRPWKVPSQSDSINQSDSKKRRSMKNKGKDDEEAEKVN